MILKEKEDDLQLDINSCFELYISPADTGINCPPPPRVRLVLEGWSRVKAVSDSNSSMGTIFVLGTTQNLNFSKPPIVIIGFL